MYLIRPIKTPMKQVAISTIRIHNSLVGVDQSNCLTESPGSIATHCRLSINAPVCYFDGSEFIAVANISQLQYAKSLFPRVNKIYVQLIERTKADYYLAYELIVVPTEHGAKAATIGQRYRVAKALNLSDILNKFGDLFKSQNALSNHLGVNKKTMFPPQKKMVNSKKAAGECIGGEGVSLATTTITAVDTDEK